MGRAAGFGQTKQDDWRERVADRARGLARAALALPVAWAVWGTTPAAATVPPAAPVRAAEAVLTADTDATRRWVLAHDDHRRRPFAVVDKKAAQLFVFRADGTLAGATRVLLGLAPGDDAAPGLGRGDVTRIPPALRTTPAGRFESEPGRNLSGEAIVWFDYDAALAIHRVRPGASQARRLQRLASPGAKDKRDSLGCVVVPPAFYDAVVAPTLGRERGVVYVLPENAPWQARFGGPGEAGVVR